MKQEKRNPNFISILMPTYNVKAYVQEAVESIINQSYSNFELIIVDDCSTDGTYELLQELSKKDSRIRLYRNDKNRKICQTLNRALSYSKGGLIGRMDGDDISKPDRFWKLKEYLDQHPEVSLVGSDLIGIDENGKEFNKKIYPHSPKAIKAANRWISSVPHFWLARYEVYKSLNGYREVPYVEDYDFLLRGEIKGFQYANIDEALYQIRLRLGNTASTNGLRQRKAVEYIQALHKKEKRLKVDCFRYEDYCKAIEVNDKENKQYLKASKKLNMAIRKKDQPIKMIGIIAEAMMQDSYILEYILDTGRVRIIILLEHIFKGITR